MQFRVLGPLEVVGPTGPIQIRGRRERAVLAALCAEPGAVVSADRLLDRVWGDDQPENPANALQARISGLRRVLGAERIRTARPGYTLVIEREELDAWLFEDLVNEAAARSPADPATADALCADALPLWRGEPLADLDDPSLAPLLTHWSELRRRAVALRASCLLELGRPDAAVVIATAGFDEDPLDEAMARMAMIALGRAGRHAEAIRLAQRHRAAVAEVGLEVGHVIVTTERELVDPSAVVPTLGRLPPPFYGNRCIGRDRELGFAEQTIAEHRLTTLIGPGGVGKTRLARELALGHRGWWSDLSVVPSAADLSSALCHQLRVRAALGAPSTSALTEALEHETGLLVIDGTDDFTASAARLVAGLLSACPGLTVLATSRQPLGVAGEQLVEIKPLPVGADSPAADLFVDNARSSTVLTDADRPAVARIVARVEGLPLAIELAAGRLAVLGLDELVAQLDDRIGHLSTSAPARPERQRSLMSVVESSWLQLDAPERDLAVVLSLFQGWFTVADAAVVSRFDAIESARAIEGLRRCSLLQHDGRRSSPRFRFLNPVREFAWERAVAAGHHRRFRDDHADWVIDNLTAARAAHRGPSEAASIDAVVALRPDLDAALDSAGSSRRLAILAPLAELVAMRLTAEDAARFTDAVQRHGVVDPWVGAGAAQAAFVSGDLERAETLCRQADAAAVESAVEVPWLTAWLTGSIALFAGDAACARRRYESSLAARTDSWERALLGAASAFAAVVAGDRDAPSVAASAVAAARRIGNPTSLSMALCALGGALAGADRAAARDAFEEALALALATANQVTAGLARPRIAALHSRATTDLVPRALHDELGEWQRRGNRSHAAEVVALSIPVLGSSGNHRAVAVLAGSIRDATGSSLQLPGDRARIAAAVTAAETELGAEGFATASAEGALLDVDGAVVAARRALELIHPS